DDDGDVDGRQGLVGPRNGAASGGDLLGDGVLDDRVAPCAYLRPALVRFDRIRRQVDPLAVLDEIQTVDSARGVIDPVDADVVALQHFAQLGADQLHNALEVERA